MGLCCAPIVVWLFMVPDLFLACGLYEFDLGE